MLPFLCFICHLLSGESSRSTKMIFNELSTLVVKHSLEHVHVNHEKKWEKLTQNCCGNQRKSFPLISLSFLYDVDKKLVVCRMLLNLKHRLEQFAQLFILGEFFFNAFFSCFWPIFLSFIAEHTHKFYEDNKNYDRQFKLTFIRCWLEGKIQKRSWHLWWHKFHSAQQSLLLIALTLHGMFFYSSALHHHE